MNRVELFPGWEVKVARFDHGARIGLAVSRPSLDGVVYRHAVRCESKLAAKAMRALKIWAAETEAEVQFA